MSSVLSIMNIIQTECADLKDVTAQEASRQQQTKAPKRRKSETRDKKAKRWKGVKLFNFKKNWHLVQPHLKEAEASLNLPMLLSTARFRAPYDKRKGPWSYSSNDVHIQEIYDQALEAMRRGEFKCPKGHSCEDCCEGEKCKQLCAEFKSFEKTFNPKPGTYQWYQSFGNCHFLVPWLTKLGKLMFPNLIWVDLYGDCHSVSLGLDNNGRLKMVFDILFFDRMTRDQILNHVTLKSPNKEVASDAKVCGVMREDIFKKPIVKKQT